MSHLLKGGNVGQNIINNTIAPPRETLCVQIIPSFKFATEHYCLS